MALAFGRLDVALQLIVGVRQHSLSLPLSISCVDIDQIAATA
jgi:hypothetical protein